MLAADDEEPETHRHPFSQEEHTHPHSAKTGTHASERGKEIRKGRHQASAVHLTWLPKFTEGTLACLREGTGCRAFGSSVVLRVRLCPDEISAPTQKDGALQTSLSPQEDTVGSLWPGSRPESFPRKDSQHLG